jgi:hypothetical protein
MKDLFEETKQLVNYRQSTCVDLRDSMYRAIDDLKDNVGTYSTCNYELIELLFVISDFKQIINKLSTVGLFKDSDWELMSEILRKLDSSCRYLIDRNDEM